MREKRSLFLMLGLLLLFFCVFITAAFSRDDAASDSGSPEIDEIIAHVSLPIAEAEDSATDDGMDEAEKKNGNQNAGVMPPNSRPGGLTYGEWNEEWWQWAFSMPIDDHPLYDTADISEGQAGKVLFLGSSFKSEQAPTGETITSVDREISISPGTKVLIPLFNVEVSTIEGYEGSEEEMQDQAGSFLDYVESITVLIDGKPVEDPEQYESPSPLFEIGPLPENNVLQDLGADAPAGSTGQAAANGYYLMLPPLSVGEHTIEYLTPIVVPGGNPDGSDWIWTQDVKYTINVEPNKGDKDMGNGSRGASEEV